MDRTAVVKVGAAASASVCVLVGGLVLTQYIVAKKKRAGKKTKIIEMVSYLQSITPATACVLKTSIGRQQTGSGSEMSFSIMLHWLQY